MTKKRIGAYVGVDPTAASLHLGHLLPCMPLFWMYLHGYGAFSIIGGSTAKIGDPTGRTSSRPNLKSSELVQNLTGIHYQLKSLWAQVDAAGIRFGYKREWAWRRGIVNNNTWWNSLPLLEVIRRLGTQLRLGPMLSRDNVKTRLGKGSGMSFAEFTYPLMQAWDWYEMFKQRGVQMQIGGSDQYGNILTGAACVKHCVENEPDPAKKLPSDHLDQPIGFTVPLLTDSSGAKFGKSAGNAIWLDPFQTTPYDMYGYLVRRSDEEVEKLLKLFTFFPLEKIAEVMAEHNSDPPKRVAQHLLAYEVLWLVHGSKKAEEAQARHRLMYGGGATASSGSVEQLPEHYETAPNSTTIVERPRADIKLPFHVLENTLPRIVEAAGLASSRSDADRTIKAGGIHIGGAPGSKSLTVIGMNPDQLTFRPAKTWNIEANKNFLIDGKILLLRRGRHNIRCIEFIPEEEWKALGISYPGQPGTGALRAAREALKALQKSKKKKDADPVEDPVE